MNITSNLKITKVEATAGAATSAVETDAVDMAGFEAVAFLASLGTAAANNSVKAQQSNDAAGSPDDWSDLEGSAVDSASGVTDLVTEVYRPTKRYVRAVVTRGTSSTVEAVWAIQSGAAVAPVTNTSATQAVGLVAGPAEGTA